jgi:hypothetical protein
LIGTQEGAPGWNSRPWLSERILAMRHDPPKIAVGVAGGCRVKCFDQRRMYLSYVENHFVFRNPQKSAQLRRDS